MLYPQTASSAIRSAVAVTVTAKLGEVVHGRASRLLSDPFADAARCRGCRRVVGHSYGGAVISDAATGVANVVGLVFASAFAPDEGETLDELNARFAPPPGAAHFQVDSLGFVWLDPAAFPANFVQDVALQEARVMAAVQEPIGQPSPSRRGRWRGGGCRRGPGLHRCPDDLPRPAAVHGRPRRRQDRGGSLQQRLGGLPPHQVARLVLAAARVGTRGWAGVAAELASGRGHGPQPGGIDPPDRRRGQPAQEWSGPEVAGRKAAQVEPGVAGAAHQP